MNKSELIEALAQEINIPLRESDAITNLVLDSMAQTLADGDSIEIRGFGSSVVRDYGSYHG
jgi:integration host factor subunit beta